MLQCKQSSTMPGVLRISGWDGAPFLLNRWRTMRTGASGTRIRGTREIRGPPVVPSMCLKAASVFLISRHSPSNKNIIFDCLFVFLIVSCIGDTYKSKNNTVLVCVGNSSNINIWQSVGLGFSSWTPHHYMLNNNPSITKPTVCLNNS